MATRGEDGCAGGVGESERVPGTDKVGDLKEEARGARGVGMTEMGMIGVSVAFRLVFLNIQISCSGETKRGGGRGRREKGEGRWEKGEGRRRRRKRERIEIGRISRQKERESIGKERMRGGDEDVIILCANGLKRDRIIPGDFGRDRVLTPGTFGDGDDGRKLSVLGAYEGGDLRGGHMGRGWFSLLRIRILMHVIEKGKRDVRVNKRAAWNSGR